MLIGLVHTSVLDLAPTVLARVLDRVRRLPHPAIDLARAPPGRPGPRQLTTKVTMLVTKVNPPPRHIAKNYVVKTLFLCLRRLAPGHCRPATMKRGRKWPNRPGPAPDKISAKIKSFGEARMLIVFSGRIRPPWGGETPTQNALISDSRYLYRK